MSLQRFGGGGLACDVLKFVFLHRFFHKQEGFSRRIKSSANKELNHRLSDKTNSNVNTLFRHSKNEWARTFNLNVTLSYYYMESLH